jgi:protein TonB
MPEFPGGIAEMKKFIQDNIKYPTFTKEAGKQGTVWVTYIVEKDGSVTNLKEAKGIPGAPDLTKEAIRVVASFPKHKPGLMNGRAVRVQQTVPVKFV